jgi:sugar phosphate isomerase/epimerase
MRVGIVDCLLRVREDAAFYLARELGFDTLELTVDRIGDPGRLLFDPELPDEVRHLGDDSGVRAESVHVLQFLDEELFPDDDDLRLTTVAGLRELFDAMSRAGIGLAVLPCFGQSDPAGRSDSSAVSLMLDHLASIATAFGVEVALKTMLDPKDLERMLSRYRPAPLGVCFDPANEIAAGRDPLAAIRILGPRIRHVHLKNRTAEGDPADLDAGILDVAAMLGSLRDLGYDGRLVLEVPAETSAIDRAKRNLSETRRLLDGLTASAPRAAA